MGDLADRLQWVWRAWRYRLKVESNEVRFLLQHVGPGHCAVDLGAHKGAYTYWMARAVGPQGHVFSFEPQPDLAARLRRVAAAAGLRQVKVEGLAASDRAAEVVLTVPTGRPCRATVEPSAAAGRALAVRAVALDDYFDAHPALRVAFLKCDVEGHELRVFRGAERILRIHRPHVLFECELRHRAGGSVGEVLDHLAGLGYQGWFHAGGRRHPVAAFRPEMQASPGAPGYVNNFLFCPRAR